MSTPITAVNLALDDSAIQSEGSNFWWYKRVDKAGGALTAPDVWHAASSRLASTFIYRRTEDQKFDEGNSPRGTKKNPLVATLEVTQMQDDVATEEFWTREVEGKYFSVVQGCGVSRILASTALNYQKIRFMPICKFQQGYETTAPDGREPKGLVLLQDNLTTLTFGAASPNTINELITDINQKLNLDATASALVVFTVAIGNNYKVLECKMTY